MLTSGRRFGILVVVTRSTPITLPDSTDGVVFAHLVQSWLDRQGAANTRSAYGKDLSLFGAWCAGRDAVPLRVTPADVVAYQDACVRAGDSPSTVRRRSSSLSSFFQFALTCDAVGANPVVGTNRPTVGSGDPSPTPALAQPTVDQYLDDAAALDSRLHALVALIALDGLKLGEALALDVDDITGRSPRLAATVSRGGRRTRLVLHRRAGAAVRRCAGDRRDGPLFLGRGSGSGPARLTRFGADHLIKRLPRRGPTPLTANALRRFYVSSSHAAGVDIDDIRERAGLSDVRSARRYLHNHNPSDGHGSGRRTDTKED
jgi:site-specific recombinase XerD